MLKWASPFVLIIILGLLSVPAGAAETKMKDIDHPFLLWTPEEAAALRKRIETDPASKAQYDMMATTQVGKGHPTLWNLFNYMVMGDKAAGEREKKALLQFIGRKPEPMTWDVDPKTLKWNEGMPSSGDRHMRDEQTLNTLRYDVLYHELTPQQRAGVEKALRAYIDFHLDGHKPWHPAFRYDRMSWLPNMHWPRAIGTHLMAVALKDQKAIDAMFRSDGGWKWFFDEYISDERFYNEEFGKYYSNIGTMLMYCEGLHRLGLDQYGYGYTGKGGATMRKYLEMPMWIGFPRLEAPEGGMPRYPTVVMGDAGELELIGGYNAKGKGGNRIYSTAHMNGPLPKLQLPAWYEIGHRRFPDAHFDYFLAQLRKPGEKVYLPSLYWGVGPIDPKRVTPPAAPSYVTRERGFAMLRADETPSYWEGPRPAVALQFGMYYVHYVHDCFSILRYVSHNRAIYERMGKGTKKGYAGGDKWRDSVRGHCGVVVDGLQAQPVDRGNNGCENQRIREHLAGPARFVAVQAEGVYPNVNQERALVLTDEYLFDLFWLASDKPRRYDWQVLARGGIVGLDNDAWAPLEGKSERWLHLHTLHTMSSDDPWSAIIMQDEEARGVGVKVSALAEDGTTVVGSTPPGMAQGDGASLIIARDKPETVFAVLHEPFQGGSAKAPNTQFTRIAQTKQAIGVKVTGRKLSDRILLDYGPAVSDKPITLEGDGESFTFTSFGFVRISRDVVEVTGDISAMKLRVTGNPMLKFNGKPAAATVSDGIMRYSAQ